MTRLIKNHALYLSWCLASIGSLMSLYYSWVLNIAPCSLCYAQRVCLFPLAIILGIAYYRSDHAIAIYSLPLCVVGFCISLYQVVLQELPGLISNICGEESCAEKLFVLGPISMPMASCILFLIIGILQILCYRINSSTHSSHSDGNE